MQARLILPASIVIAGALVGLGLFLGLRSSAQPDASVHTPPSAPAPDAPAGVALDLPMQTSAPAEADSSRPPPGAELQQRVSKEVAAQLEAKRASIARQCWDPSAKASSEPKSMVFRRRATGSSSWASAGTSLRGFAQERRFWLIPAR